MPKLNIDGADITVQEGLTVLQACEQAGQEIPRFCYHSKLSIAGNCRMCLVELEKAPKPIASCAMPAAEGMVIRTNSASVKKAREGVMEFLLINHPLDCPICDQGGECDLQDQAMGYGRHFSRFEESKRAVKDKDLGPLVGTVMTRCIHCTRCIRFGEEIAGVGELGAVFRGEHMEVGTYVEKAVHSELSGNLIDLCPVGALTSKPYSFTARPWELRKTESIDTMDAVGSNIRIDARGREIMRILPRLNEDVNEEWISDKSRFSCDGLKFKRLDRPWVRINGSLEEASWAEAFDAIKKHISKIQSQEIAAICGDMVDCESIFSLKLLMDNLKSQNLDCRQDNVSLETGVRAGYIFNSSIAGIDIADNIFLVGTNPRHEAPIINARIRKRWLQGNTKISLLGEKHDLTYDFDHLGDSPVILKQIADGNHPYSDSLLASSYPMLVVGQGALTRPDGEGILYQARRIVENMLPNQDNWSGFNVLHTAANRVGGLDIGFVPGPQGKNTKEILNSANSNEIKLVYLLSADEIDATLLSDTFVVYQGHHGDVGASVANVILPGAAYTEKEGTWVNTEGRPQRTNAAVQPPGDAKEDWSIIRALSEFLDITLPFNSLYELRTNMVRSYPHLANIDQVRNEEWGKFGKEISINEEKLKSSVKNFYMTDPISRSSPTMAKCIEAFSPKIERKNVANG